MILTPGRMGPPGPCESIRPLDTGESALPGARPPPDAKFPPEASAYRVLKLEEFAKPGRVWEPATRGAAPLFGLPPPGGAPPLGASWFVEESAALPDPPANMLLSRAATWRASPN